MPMVYLNVLRQQWSLAESMTGANVNSRCGGGYRISGGGCTLDCPFLVHGLSSSFSSKRCSCDYLTLYTRVSSIVDAQAQCTNNE